MSSSGYLEDTSGRVLTTRGFLQNEFSGNIAEIYQKQFDVSVDTKSWPYRSEVLNFAVKAIGNLNSWLSEMEKSPYVYGRRYDFLVDTIRFVETGKRSLDTHSWFELLEDNVLADRTARVNRDKIPRPKAFRTEAFLAQWCAQPKGFQDMLCSLNVLFGYPKEHSVPAGPFERH